MYQIQREVYNGSTFSHESIYDQSQISSPSAIGPKCNLELNEGGSLQFTLTPGHSMINVLEPLADFVRLLDDGEEIFYGRILQRSEPTLTGQISYQCEGALCFLLDSEIAPYGKDDDGNQITREQTAEAFFNECIACHNSDVDNDPRRSFVVGTVSAAKKSKTATYSITSYTQTKSAIQSQLLDVYGGFLRVRPVGDGRHYIDWIENYETVNPQEITIGENLESQTNEVDGSSVFTVLRPVGKDGITLSPATIDLYPPEGIAKYGRIVKSIQFTSADTTAKLQSEAQDYINSIQKTLFATSNIQLVDMHYLDGTSPKIRLGDRFTNIQGLGGLEVVASSVSLDLEHPQNDTLDLKNRKSLDPDLTPEGNTHKNSTSLSKKNATTAKTQGQYFKYLKEHDGMLEILADHVNMHGDLLEQHYNKILTTAGYYERISSRVDNAEGIILDQKKKVNDIEYNIRTIEGTGVIQNSQAISNLAGKFELWEDPVTHKTTVHLVNGAEIAVDSVNGGTITVGERIGQLANDYGEVKTVTDSVSGSALWTQRDKITGIAGEYDIVYSEIPDPDHEGETLTVKTLVLNSGGGMRIRKDNVDYGIYMTPNAAYKPFTPRVNENPKESGLYEKVGDSYVRTNDTTAVSGKQYYYRDPNVDAVLTGGLMVEEINRQTRTKILGARVDINAEDVKIRAEQSLDSVVGHFEEKWIWDVDDQGNRVKRYYLEYVADAGMIVKRLDNEGIMTEYGVWDDGNLTGGVMVQLINGQAEVHIKGSKVFVGDGAENVEENLANWSSDTDENYSLVTSNLLAERARINDIVADYVKASTLYTTIGGIEYITGQAISVTGSVTGKNIYADNGEIHIRKFSSQGVPQGDANLSEAVSSANITLTGDTYTLHLYDMFGNELTAPQGKVMTFSRATALSGAFGSGENLGTLTITASPQGNEYKVYFPKSEPNTLTNAILISDTDNNAIAYAISEDSGDKNNVYLKTIGVVNGSAQTVKVAKYSHNQYRAGWKAAYGDVDVPSQTANGQSMHVEWPSMTQDGTVNTRDYTLYTMTNNKVGVRYWSGSSYITVAEYPHNKYTAGGTDAGVTGAWVGNKYTATRAANTATKSVEVTVDINPSTAQDLDPGGSVTIYARGNSDNKASVTVSAKSVTAGASQPEWDSTNKNFYTYGYAYKSGSSAAIATSAKQTSGTVTLNTGSWSNGTRQITVACGNTNMFTETINIPSGYYNAAQIQDMFSDDPDDGGFDVTVSGTAGREINGFENGGSGYYLSGDGRAATAAIVMRGTFKVGAATIVGYSYLETAPTNLYRKGYDNGKSAAHSVSGFDTTAADTSVTYNNLTNNSDGYCIGTSGENGTAYIVVKGTWRCDGEDQEEYNYLAGSTTALYRKGYADGKNAGGGDSYDADHSLFIAGPVGNDKISSYTVYEGDPKNLWPGFKKSDGKNYQWGSPCKVYAVGTHSQSRSSLVGPVRTENALINELGTSNNFKVSTALSETGWYGFTVTCGGVSRGYYWKVS